MFEPHLKPHVGYAVDILCRVIWHVTCQQKSLAVGNVTAVVDPLLLMCVAARLSWHLA